MTFTSNPSTDTAQINKPTLKLGSKGEVVKELQNLLLDQGVFLYISGDGACVYPGGEVIDGIFGLKTEAGVKLFQGLMFQQQDGIVGNKTWRSLYKGAPVDMAVLKKGVKGELVQKVQERLSTGGYYNRAIDGDFGTATETAVKELQKSTSLPIDGVIGERTWFELSKITTIIC